MMGDIEEAIKNNRIDAARSIIANLALSQLNAKFCLHWAVLYNRKEIVEILLNSDMDVNSYGLYNFQTALYIAAEARNQEMIELLLNYGAHPDRGLQSPLRRKPAEGGNMSLYSLNDTTPLMKAVEKGHVSVVRRLIAAGANVNFVDHVGYSALILSVETNNIELVEVLMQHGANVEQTGPSGRTVYAMAQCEEIRNLLMSAGRSRTSRLVGKQKAGGGDRSVGWKVWRLFTTKKRQDVYLTEPTGNKSGAPSVGQSAGVGKEKGEKNDDNEPERTSNTSLFSRDAPSSAVTVVSIDRNSSDPHVVHHLPPLPIAAAVASPSIKAPQLRPPPSPAKSGDILPSASSSSSLSGEPIDAAVASQSLAVVGGGGHSGGSIGGDSALATTVATLLRRVETLEAKDRAFDRLQAKYDQLFALAKKQEKELKDLRQKLDKLVESEA